MSHIGADRRRKRQVDQTIAADTEGKGEPRVADSCLAGSRPPAAYPGPWWLSHTHEPRTFVGSYPQRLSLALSSSRCCCPFGYGVPPCCLRTAVMLGTAQHAISISRSYFAGTECRILACLDAGQGGVEMRSCPCNLNHRLCSVARSIEASRPSDRLASRSGCHERCVSALVSHTFNASNRLLVGMNRSSANCRRGPAVLLGFPKAGF